MNFEVISQRTENIFQN